MGNIIVYSPRGTVSNSSVGSGSGGGDVEDILQRLGSVETQVGAILAVMPHLATKADVVEMKADIANVHLAMKADIASVHLAMKADVADVRVAVAQVKTDVAAIETKIIKWIIATTLASAALAFSIAKFVH